MSELIEANPTLEQQLRDWQTERHRRGENAFDWQAFRAMVTYMGSCDPGSEPPSEFFWFTPPEHATVLALEAEPSTNVMTARRPSGRLVQPGLDRGPGGSGERLTEVKYWR
ncbi:MAG: hypothetical protein IT306_21080 [Chloroflexi bacterium]|nr:hypothetical protein [Chloroflexota bacterium]